MRFRTLAVDPPWRYGSPGTFKEPVTPGVSVSASARYRGTMDLPDLIALGRAIRAVAEDNAHLYLWATNAFVEDAHKIARAWGFKPITLHTWVKCRKDGQPTGQGTGYYFRNTTEHVLFCVRGTLPTRDHRTAIRTTAHLWPHPGRHSDKPEGFYALAEDASYAPRLELFARRPRPEWTTLGNEIDGRDIRAALADLAGDELARAA